MMPTAAFTPVSATLPASRTAWLSGSPPPWFSGAEVTRGGSALGAGRDAGLDDEPRAVVVRAAARPPVERFARWVVAVARACERGLLDDALVSRAVEPVERLSLRRPGRERGRLPSTPGSSLSSAATDGKTSARSGVTRSGPGNPLRAVDILG
jgi:hypothetical protein